MLTRAVRIHPAEQLAEHVVLPGQEQERLAGVLPLGVPKDFLKE